MDSNNVQPDYIRCMTKYPLEWGWDQPQTQEPSATPSAGRETLLGRRPDTNVELAGNYGDLKCSSCEDGGDWGTTGHYEIKGDIHCRNCAVKILRLDGLSGKEQDRNLKRFELLPNR